MKGKEGMMRSQFTVETVESEQFFNTTVRDPGFRCND